MLDRFIQWLLRKGPVKQGLLYGQPKKLGPRTSTLEVAGSSLDPTKVWIDEADIIPILPGKPSSEWMFCDNPDDPEWRRRTNRRDP